MRALLLSFSFRQAGPAEVAMLLSSGLLSCLHLAGCAATGEGLQGEGLLPFRKSKSMGFLLWEFLLRFDTPTTLRPNGLANHYLWWFAQSS